MFLACRLLLLWVCVFPPKRPSPTPSSFLTLNQAATLGALQTAIAASPFAIPVEKQRVIRFKSDGNAAVLSDPTKVLIRDYNVWSGEDVVCEVGVWGEVAHIVHIVQIVHVVHMYVCEVDSPPFRVRSPSADELWVK